MRKRNKFLYNPHEQDKEDLIAHFVVRQHIFKRIFSDIQNSTMENPEQHYYIEGQRGMGKTTLLLRLRYEIENDEKLNDWLIPVLLKEEAYYGISKLHRLWEEVAKILEEYPGFDGLYNRMENSYVEGTDYEKICYGLLMGVLQLKRKKIVIMLDNLNEILDNFTEMESHRFREILLTCSHIRFIGASSRPLEASYNYKHAFFDFFKLVTLKQLNEEETRQVLLELGKIYNQENKIKSIIKYHPERIEALRILTGGVIRTIVLLFDIFVSKESINSFSALEKVLDSTTALYKHRIDDLKPYQREIVDIIAMNWDGMLAEEIAMKARQPLENIQKILDEIEKAYIIESVIQKGQKTYYQIRERFFNIWYLMRLAPNSGKKKIIWLVRFLNTYYSRTEIREQAVDYLKSIGQGLYSPSETLLRAEILRSTEQLDSDLEHDLLNQTRNFLSEKDKNAALHLAKSSKDNLKHAKSLYRAGQTEEAISYLKNCSTRHSYQIGCLFYDSGEYKNAMPYFEAAVEEDGNYIYARNALANCYALLEDYDNAILHYRKAIELDETYGSCWGNLGLSYQNKADYKASIECLEQALVHEPSLRHLHAMAYAFTELGEYAKALQFYQRAHELEPDNKLMLQNLVYCYEKLRQFRKAAEFQTPLWKKDMNNTGYLKQLVNLHIKNKAWAEASTYQEKLLQILPMDKEHRQKLLEIQVQLYLADGQYHDFIALLAKYAQPVTIRTDHLKTRSTKKAPAVVKMLEEKLFQAECWSLPFYKKYKLYKFTPRTNYPIQWFYALADEHDFLPLDLTNGPLYAAGETQFQIDGLTMASYVLFFFDAVAGRYGKFHIVRNIDDILWDQQKELSPELKDELEQHFEHSWEIELVNGEYVQGYSMTFKDSLFTSNIHVGTETGFVSLSDEKLVIEGLPILEVDEKIKLQYVAHLFKLIDDRTYSFQSLKELAEIIALTTDKYPQAIEYYKMALYIKPNDLEVLSALAETYVRNREVNEGIGVYIKAYELGAKHHALTISNLLRTNLIDKPRALYFAEQGYQENNGAQHLIAYLFALLWNDKLAEAKEQLSTLFSEEFEEGLFKQIIELCLMFAAKDQADIILEQLYKVDQDKWDFFMPLRYCLQKLTGNEEYKRSPTELSDTISDMEKKVWEFKGKYG